jgi:hypothetical protein
MGDHWPAESRYWQLRLVLSWDAEGGVTWSLSGKDYENRWQDMQHLRGGFSRLGHVPEGSINEGLRCMEAVMQSDLLPRDET